MKDEELYRILSVSSTIVSVEWDERLSVPKYKDRKKEIKEKILLTHRGKFIVDYKRSWEGKEYQRIPTDIINITILEDDQTVENFKQHLLEKKMNSLCFVATISPINGGESLKFTPADGSNENVTSKYQ